MPVGTFFKTAFEKGLASHEQVVKALKDIAPVRKNPYWSYHVGLRQPSVLPQRAGLALGSRLRLPGKNRQKCIPSGVFSARELLHYTTTDCVVDEVPVQVLVNSQSYEGIPHSCFEEVSIWQNKLEVINAQTPAFNNGFNITNENISKEVIHRLCAPSGLSKDAFLCIHDGELGSNPLTSMKVTVVSNDPLGALYLRHMVNPSPQVDPVDFENMFSVFHIGKYEPRSSQVIEEFGGYTEEMLGLNSKQFVLFNLAERNVFISGSAKVLQDAILCFGSLLNYHIHGNLIMHSTSFLDKEGNLVLVFGAHEKLLLHPQLYGAHHHLLTSDGVSRLWNGVTKQSSKQEYASDVVEQIKNVRYVTSPLPLQIGGTVRPRGSNLPFGEKLDSENWSFAGREGRDIERLPDLDPAKPWRSPFIPKNVDGGIRFVFVSKNEAKLSVEDAAQMFAKQHNEYPLGYTTKQQMKARFIELVKDTKITFHSVSDVSKIL